MSPLLQIGSESLPLSVAGAGAVAELTAIADRLAQLSAATAGEPVGAVPDAERIDRIALLERLRAAASAAQAAEMVAFASSQVEQQRQEVDYRRLGRGIADQIALACKISPSAGSRRLSLARAWRFDLPATFGALRRGEVNEWVATLVARETSHLDGQTRRRVDVELASHRLAAMSPRQAAATARGLAYRADPQAAVDRVRVEESERRVSLRPAPDCMAILTAYLPAASGVAALAALQAAADTAASGETRTRGQLMADTLVERVTGQRRAVDVNIDVGVLVPVETLVDPASARSAELGGYGPIPAQIARDLLTRSSGRRLWRRLFTAPTGVGTSERVLIGTEPRRRRFEGLLADLILARDRHCRDPYCEAPIRHLDHVQRYADGGPTTFGNGRGVCARGNYVREMPGWQLRATHSGLAGAPHQVVTITPTGHRYLSTAPQPP